MLPEIVFETKLVKPKNGVYRCPFKCGDKRFSQPKWKTEKGFLSHMATCNMRPSAVARREKEAKEKKELNAMLSEKALSICPVKIGDTVFYVAEIITRPTHNERGTRIRYEPEKIFEPRTAKVTAIAWGGNIGEFGGDYFFNGSFWLSQTCESREKAEEKTIESQKSWDEYVAFSSSCR